MRPTITNTYDIATLHRVAKYLVQIEDRVPVAFFIDDRALFNNVINFYRQISKWQKEGYTKVALTHYPDIKVNIYQPYWDYYLWTARLQNTVKVEPLK